MVGNASATSGINVSRNSSCTLKGPRRSGVVFFASAIEARAADSISLRAVSSEQPTSSHCASPVNARGARVNESTGLHIHVGGFDMGGTAEIPPFNKSRLFALGLVSRVGAEVQITEKGTALLRG